MLTKAKVIRNNADRKILINAVLNRIGLDSVQDVVSHGASAGFIGFIYYSDTHKFAMRYRKHIINLLEQQANDMGEEVTAMVASFGVFRKSPMDDADRQELYKYLGGGKCEQSAITNVMAWFALEEVCRMFDME